MIHTTDFIATFGVKTKWKHLMAEQKVYVPTVGEEVANAVSHGVMLCLTLAALPFAAVRAYVHDGTLAAVAASVFGIIYKSLARRSIPAVSLTIYLVMGWTIVFFMPLFVRHASMPLLVLIAAGGVLYTAGAWVYARKGFRYHHMVWHLLINLAAICHFTAIVFYLY